MKISTTLSGLVLFTLTTHACAATCKAPSSPIEYELGGSSFIINKYIGEGNQKAYAKDAQATPSVHPTVFTDCGYTFQNSFFELTSDSGLDPNDYKFLPTPSGTRKFLAIKSTQDRIDMPLIYMSYAIYDPGYSNDKIVITEPNYTYKIIKNNVQVRTLGLTLDKIYLYVVVDEKTPAQSYSLASFKIGEMYAKEFTSSSDSVGKTPSKRAIVNIKGLRFQIKQSTCNLDKNNYMVQLDTAAVKDFKAANQLVRPKNFNITFSCPDEPNGTAFVARIHDTHSDAVSNLQGLLLNQTSSEQGGSNVAVQLLDASNTPIRMSSDTQDEIIDFGRLINHQIIYPIKAGYIAPSLPVTIGQVNAIATISVDYN